MMPISSLPYHRLQRSANTLLAARGSSIDSFSLVDGSHLSTWSIAPPPPAPATTASCSPPAKRRKLLSEEDIENGEATQQNGSKENGNVDSKKEKKQNDRADAVATGFETPAIICLEVTKDGKYVVAVTAEDKSVRVFETITGDGGKQELKQISSRQMPKRPCAITLTSDSKTIISADKFGDVYSLPIIPSPSPPPGSTIATPEPSKPYQPAANELTIHSQRNRKALEHQRKLQPKPANNDKPVFEGKLLLGHVSMLIDLILANVGSREYILTADRDEHIRISRGGDQSHIIEGFCLGHQEFVTRLCIPRTRPEVLISGGGEDELFVWDWLNRELLGKVDVKSHVTAVLKTMPSLEGNCIAKIEARSLVVSGIHHTQAPVADSNEVADIVLVSVEGVPAVFIYHLLADSTLQHIQTVPLNGNPLDILTDIPSPTGDQQASRVLISIDTIYKRGLTTELRTEAENEVQPFEAIQIRNGEALKVEGIVFQSVDGSEKVEQGKLSTLLYGLESLRKREGEDREE